MELIPYEYFPVIFNQSYPSFGGAKPKLLLVPCTAFLLMADLGKLRFKESNVN